MAGEVSRMNELEIILEYIEKGKNKKRAEELLRDDRWQTEKGKLERLLALLRKNRNYDEECPDFGEAVRFYYGELPSDRREAFIGHLIRCQGLCIDALMSLRESEKKALAASEEKDMAILGELHDKGLVSEGFLNYISRGLSPYTPANSEQLRAYDFLQRYKAAVVALSLARAVRGRRLRAGGEGAQSVAKESDSFRVEIYPSPEAPGRLEAEVSLKSEVERDRYEGAEVLIFVQTREGMLSGIGAMKDGLVSGLALRGGQVSPRIFDDPELVRIEIYIGERKQ